MGMRYEKVSIKKLRSSGGFPICTTIGSRVCLDACRTSKFQVREYDMIVDFILYI